MGVIYETSIYAFLFVTVLLGGSGAFMIGRASAKRWKPFTEAVFYILMLGAAVRFLHWGLFVGATFASWQEVQGSLFSIHYYIADIVVLTLFAGLGFRLQRTRQMTHQYAWFIEKTSPLSWRQRDTSS